MALADLRASDKSVDQQRALVGTNRAAIEGAEADSVRARREFARTENLVDAGAVTARDLDVATSDDKRASANVKSNVAALAGAERKVDVLRAQVGQLQAKVAQANAQVQKAKLDLENTVVRSPIAGTVLRVRVRPGQFAEARAADSDMVVVGNIDPLHVRVDLDEVDIARFHSGAEATISPRGAAAAKIPVAYVRTEPLVVPKRSLTGASAERVDTRVLQVLYALPKGSEGFFPGQQVDVYIQAIR